MPKSYAGVLWTGDLKTATGKIGKYFKSGGGWFHKNIFGADSTYSM